MPDHHRRLLAYLGALLLIPTLLLGMLAWLIPLPARLGQPGSTVVELRDGSPAAVFLSPDDKWRIPIQLAEVDTAYLTALLRLEDKRFRAHPGIDPLAVFRAASLNLRRGQVVSGGSTLTMQLVRVLEPRPRTMTSKVIEVFRALQLELRMSKNEILEAYLQFIPFGRNMEGVQAAALSYFGHTARSLSPAEIATLLAVPQRPAQRYPTPRNADRLRQARDKIARRLLEQDALPRGAGQSRLSAADVLLQVKATEVPQDTRPFPQLAPHAAVWLKAKYPHLERIRTTLDRSAQLLAERMLNSARADLSHKGIFNASAVVVDHRTAEVRALVGNFDFWDDRHGGQIAAFDVPRSPGSALKPFLYSMAIEAGLSLPDFLVLDIPETYGAYSPHNYSRSFSGLVRLEDALSQSLNIPFVNLLRDFGVERFVANLRAMGAQSLNQDPGHYGLSSVVGGIELTPLELAGLYTTLARDGGYLPLSWLRASGAPGQPGRQSEGRSGVQPERPRGPPSERQSGTQRERPRGPPLEGPQSITHMMAPGATWLTRQALSLKDRPDFPSRRQLSGMPAHIHWKTGTSFGHRDAWAAGSGPRYTAVVWLGNLDNSPSVDLVGSDAAGPVLFDLLEGLGFAPQEVESPYPPADLTYVEMCAYSGRSATSACARHKRVLALRQSVPTAKCPYHVALDVDLETGLALTPACRSGRAWETRDFLVWPSSLRRWLKDELRTLPEAPPYAPGCEVGEARRGPAIRSPAPGQAAILIQGLSPDRQQIALEAESGSASLLSWFVDGEFLGSVAAEERLWWTPKLGRHEIVVTDEAGLSGRRRFEVRARP